MKSARLSSSVCSLALLVVFAAPSLADAGPVRVLHDWLGGQCSFVPDLDVGGCCAVHDDAYQDGGKERDRLQADLAFRACIIDHNRPLVGWIYFIGVRAFGWAFFNYH